MYGIHELEVLRSYSERLRINQIHHEGLGSMENGVYYKWATVPKKYRVWRGIRRRVLGLLKIRRPKIPGEKAAGKR